VDVSYRIGPRINASGRLADASLPLNLLLAETVEDSERDAELLDQINRERQEIDKRVTDDATEQAKSMGEQEGYVLFGDWHPGVVGIAAGKICRAMDRPVIVLGKEGDIAKGSGRSVPGVNLVEALNSCAEILKTYGGHPMAVGISLAASDVEQFRAQFTAAVALQKKSTNLVTDSRDLDITHWLKLNEINEGLLDDMELLQPYGESNSEPIFGVRGFVFDKTPTLFGEGNIRFQVSLSAQRRLSFIAWRMSSRIPEVGKSVDLAVKLAWNRWQGRKSIQVEIVDWRYSA
jgi:single-stranded-DNA-specific exonuclease